jgi:hypothetical protein
MSEKPTQFDPQAIDAYDSWLEKHLVSRRQAIGLGALTAGAFASTAILADPPKLAFSKESEDEVARAYPNVHEGNGTISVRYFPFDNTCIIGRSPSSPSACEAGEIHSR